MKTKKPLVKNKTVTDINLPLTGNWFLLFVFTETSQKLREIR